MKEKFPKIRVTNEIHKILKTEAERLGFSMTELLELLVRIYCENPDIFKELSGGVIGTQPSWGEPG